MNSKSPTREIAWGFLFVRMQDFGALPNQGVHRSVAAMHDLPFPRSAIIAMPEIPLDEIDLEALDHFLKSDDAPEGTMSLSELDGFLTAIAIGPEAIAIEEWLAIVWDGEDPQFTGEAQAKAVLGAIASRYNKIVVDCADGSFEPILEYDADASPLPFAWARGFFEGIGLRVEAWKPLLRSERYGVLLIPILALVPDDPYGPLPQLSEEDEARFVRGAPALIPESIQAIDAYWMKRGRRQEIRPPAQHEPVGFSIKVGRNDPCPCGSGEKFKKCCGKAQ